MKTNRITRKQIGEIGVDAGLCWIGDPCYILHTEQRIMAWSLSLCMRVVMQRLLILACSQRKCPDTSSLPALERYDGPAFRVLRRYRRLTQDSGLIVYVLSAEFGLIPANKPIPLYDRRMTHARADDLQPSIAAAIQAAIVRHQPWEIFICAGKTYLQALGCLVDNRPRLSVARGGLGEKLASLKAWLHER